MNALSGTIVDMNPPENGHQVITIRTDTGELVDITVRVPKRKPHAVQSN